MALVKMNLAALNGMADAAAERGIKAATLQGEAIMKAVILSQPGTGRRYGSHVASAPGQPPAPDTGNLRARTNADPEIRHEGGDTVGRIVANVAYALPLAVGTERMAARPHLQLLEKEHAAKLRDAFVKGATNVRG